MGAAWERHAMFESALKGLKISQYNKYFFRLYNINLDLSKIL